MDCNASSHSREQQSALAEALSRLAAHFAALVVHAIQQAGPPASAEAYSSNRRPTDESKRSWNERCRRGDIPGAYKVGKVWVVPVEAYNAWAASRRPATRPANEVVDLDTRRRRALAAANLRAKGGR